MRKLVLIFVVFLALKVMSQDISNWVRIDCGAPTSYYDQNGLLWQTDDNFIKTGENRQIPLHAPAVLDQWRTLRVFREQNKNCYTIPAPTMDRYILRAMFEYANYDGLSNPPTFDIEFDGNKWYTVETDMSRTRFYEVIYGSKGQNISVCLARTRDGQYPFISMLEAWSLPDKTYRLMTKDKAWVNEYRFNYGASEAIIGYPTDKLNRIWIPPPISSGLIASNATFNSLDYTTVDEPPESAIIDLVESSTSSSPIILPFTFNKIAPVRQVLVYFTEPVEDANATREFYFSVNGALQATITPQYKNCTEYMVNTESVSALNVELMPTFDSTLPPTISAIEVYTGIYPIVAGTSQDDLDGLAVLINTFQKLKGWSGEPCLPSDTAWQWLGCTGVAPPRVNSINLSGYGLNGTLPDFSQMQALETINLSNNSLEGLIPDFLGNLPNLRLLDLRDNDFSGDIPQSIAGNKKLTYYASGNPNLQLPKGKSNSGLIIGLAVGIPVGLIFILLVALLVYYLKRRQTGPGTGQETEMSPTGNGNGNDPGQTQQENVSAAVSTEPSNVQTTRPNGLNVPTAPSYPSSENFEHVQTNEHIVPPTYEVHIPGNADAGITNHPSQMQDVDVEELSELLRQHGSSGPHPR